MSITSSSKRFRIALATAALCAAPAFAQAKPHRVVILDFDGPRELADRGHAAVVDLMGEEYDVVATKRWEQARATAERHAHGPATWLAAARQSGVDAVIAGWVQEEGRNHILTLQVLEAASGREIDSVSAKLNDHGLANDRKLQTNLDEVLQYVEGGTNDGNPHPLPVYAGIGGEKTSTHKVDKDKDKDVDPDKRTKDKGDEPAKPSSHGKDEAKTEDGKKEGETEVKPTEVATAEPKNDLNVVFPIDPLETVIISNKQAPRISRPTPRFAVGAGFYYGTRSFDLVSDNPDLITYPGNPQQGVQVSASVYPFPSQKMDGQLQGFGASFSVQHSIGSSVTFTDDNGNGEYVVQQNAWEAGIHYRWPFEIGSIDAAVTYGNQSLTIEDAPLTLETPDTSYTYIGVGGHADLKITDRASVGFGGKYMYVTDAGDAVSTDWYGPGSASGISLDADFVIPLPGNLYLRGDLKYTRININFIGIGGQFDDDNVQSATDTTISASAELGVSF